MRSKSPTVPTTCDACRGEFLSGGRARFCPACATERHRSSVREWARRWRAAQKAQGLTTHQPEYLPARRTAYAARKAAGLCVQSGCKDKAAPGRARCEACHAVSRERARACQRKARAGKPFALRPY